MIQKFDITEKAISIPSYPTFDIKMRRGNFFPNEIVYQCVAPSRKDAELLAMDAMHGTDYMITQTESQENKEKLKQIVRNQLRSAKTIGDLMTPEIARIYAHR